MTTDPTKVSALRSPLARRLALAFVAVAVTAVFVLAGLTLWRTKRTVGQLAHDRRQATTEAIARTLALGYQDTGTWAATDSHPATMLAVQAGATIQVLDTTGRPIRLPSSMGPMDTMSTATTPPHGIRQHVPVTLNGTTIGTVIVTFPGSELALAEQHVRDALRSTVALGALTAALVALGVAVPLARRVIAPIVRITDTARRLGDGDQTARAQHHNAPGELGELATTFDDMADRLDAHETIRRNLTADLAHELRTPLTLLQGGCEELLDGITPPTLARLTELHDDILRMRRLVDDLATLADADAATTEGTLRFTPVNLADVVRIATDKLRPLIDANEQHLALELTNTVVDGDPGRLAQIVTNLVTNAIKYTPSGGHITVTVEHEPATSTAVLVVSDDGSGIAPADRDHIFERFYRSELTRNINGSGIGLAVVDQLTKAHHGTIAVDATRPGTTIRVSLPVSHQAGSA